MVFDFLKRAKADISMSFDHPDLEYFPGDPINLAVEITCEKKMKIQRGTVAVLYRERFEVYDEREEDRWSQDDDDRDSGPTRTWETDEKVIHSEEILDEQELPEGFNRQFEIATTIPSDAPFTVRGANIIEGLWEAKATLDRRMAADVNEVEEFAVHSRLAGGPRNRVQSNGKSSEAELIMVLDSRDWVFGDTVTGVLEVHPTKDFEVRKILVEIEQREHVPHQDGNTKETNRRTEIAGKTLFSAGQTANIPLQIGLASELPPTRTTQHGSIEWSLRCVLERRMARDLDVAQEFGLYSRREE